MEIAIRNAVESAAMLDTMESAAYDERLDTALEPSTIYTLNQKLLFGGLDHDDKAIFARIREAGIANDPKEIEEAAESLGLPLTEEEREKVVALTSLLKKRGMDAQTAMETVRGEDGMGVPAIALLIVVVAVVVLVIGAEPAPEAA